MYHISVTQNDVRDRVFVVSIRFVRDRYVRYMFDSLHVLSFEMDTSFTSFDGCTKW